MKTDLTGAVSSNGIELPFSAELFEPMRDSTALCGDPAALRGRLRADGYLLLRGVLDPAAVLRLRKSYLDSWAADTSSQSAYGVAGHPAYNFVRSAEFADFVDQPALADLAAKLLGGPAHRLPRAILRHFTGGTRQSSRAHTDFAYMDQGSEDLITMWIPVGNCTPQGGGLVYLDGSHDVEPDGLTALRSVTDRPDDPRPLSHDLGWVARSLGRRWLWTHYRAGDVAIHTPHLVHAALDTNTPTARVSADIRFLRNGARVDPRWTHPWSAVDGA
ncbi:MAG TPA: phytanoyl-CoA dioxygenase family protein [Actinophytocola sp.]|uniref:phytanoyl-CoA dioxygenase family protein n=1 Tax=Actinophytocola sp. TaxID=1872138 RepID=UPI002DC00000|nr:phytanoyl-CoA dioxygenase family protein [Actinophytocola sp.]HEU5474333.1 phytanoyl-CoA dioxygenase family protein [Actinophytocola sp.]